MQVLVACDKFKGTLTAQQVCEVIKEVLVAHNLPDVVACPLADGGDGTAAILTFHARGAMLTVDVSDPFFRPVAASYGLAHDGKTAFIEMADASGLKIIKESERNVMKASTWGTGEMIRHALDVGVDHVVIGIGGSATNDGGMGMAAALGFEFQDHTGNRLEPVGENLEHVRRIVDTNLHPRLRRVKFTALCDVDSMFFGEQGAATVYAPQKRRQPAAGAHSRRWPFQFQQTNSEIFWYRREPHTGCRCRRRYGRRGHGVSWCRVAPGRRCSI
ncbi:MAG: glycerate kinase [Bacteroidia bacterium]|nr:glycerate kinase [Bacteroidia bacterium]